MEETPNIRLRRAREQAGHRSAAAFARQYDLPDVTYRAHENGTRGINLKMAKRYASLLNVTPSWLLTGEGAVQDKTTRNVTVTASIDSDMGGWVRPMDSKNRYTIAIRPSGKADESSMLGLVIEGGKHKEFPAGTELIFQKVSENDRVPCGKFVLVEEQSADGNTHQFVGRLEPEGQGVSVIFSGKDYKAQNQVPYLKGPVQSGLAENRESSFMPAANSNLQIEQVPAVSEKLRIVGVLVKRIHDE